ncbi:hypothetical protein QJS10_CPA10g00500 [Acorus calamus]|uniref:Uncharacterized protein n=1 Tax=Acorus calamus TaxID=4465 RepID=A0AAV9E1F0_ACOCL|nr:hypothetical protein QJS10_CPA10g00500 [Acorus calamus]
MARGVGAVRRRSSSKSRLIPYPLPFYHERHMHRETNALKTSSKALEKNDWQDATCSVCMEHPHNAVLLLCSSHDKGCRPYMCGTSYRFSNCLDQFKNAYTKEEMSELACPLCRGQVKGWTVVDPAREYLNMKKRSCMQDECAFNGTYRELRKHMRVTHPCVRPRQVDPALEQKWRRLELERERRDVITTIRATTPGALVLGDYVIEGNGGYGGHDNVEDEGGLNDRLSNRNVLEWMAPYIQTRPMKKRRI